jgi:hypothetical protein
LAGNDGIAFCATIRRFRMNPVKTGADVLPSGGYENIAFQVKDSSYCIGNGSEILA